jgi:hypothetical protein
MTPAIQKVHMGRRYQVQRSTFNVLYLSGWTMRGDIDQSDTALAHLRSKLRLMTKRGDAPSSECMFLTTESGCGERT